MSSTEYDSASSTFALFGHRKPCQSSQSVVLQLSWSSFELMWAVITTVVPSCSNECVVAHAHALGASLCRTHHLCHYLLPSATIDHQIARSWLSHCWPPSDRLKPPLGMQVSGEAPTVPFIEPTSAPMSCGLTTHAILNPKAKLKGFGSAVNYLKSLMT